MWPRPARWRGRRCGERNDSLEAVATRARANFILARAAIMTGHPDEAIDRFQKTLATSKEPRLLAWSHIYLGRMLDLECKRDEAVSEYKLALDDARRAAGYAAGRGARRQDGVSEKGQGCDDDADDDPASGCFSRGKADAGHGRGGADRCRNRSRSAARRAAAGSEWNQDRKRVKAVSTGRIGLQDREQSG